MRTISKMLLLASVCGLALSVNGQSKKDNTTSPSEGWKWSIADEKPVATLSNKGVLQLQNSIRIDPNTGIIQFGTLGTYPGAEFSRTGIVFRSDNNPYSRRGFLDNEGLTFTQHAPAKLFYNSTNIGHGRLSLKYVLNSSTDEHKIFTVEKGDLFTTGTIGIGAPAKASLYVVGNMIVKTSIDSAAAPDLIINDKGYISIGTDKIYQLKSEMFKVSVNGKIACKEIKVDAKWADFVFDQDYKLRNLSDVEQFITENKHLPGVPSAVTVESQGLAVGEMQALMMQKIEELTLYMIQLEKDNQMMKVQIEDLKATSK